jgi:hypothetical protein
MLWWWNRGSRSEGRILEIQGLTPVDGRETGAIDDHIAGRCDKVTVVLLRARHPETFIRCEERSLHFVHSGRNLTPQAASGPGDLLFDNRRLTGQLAQVFGSIEAIGWNAVWIWQFEVMLSSGP